MITNDAKQKALEAVQRLPAESTLEEVIEQLYLLYKVERGLAEADAGDTVPHEEALAERAQWRA